jgi:LmbE family N-acetylglucosaminyl deacetylase
LNNPDLLFVPRPNDYHPDHRYTFQLVQDAAYMVTVPNVCPEMAPLDSDPVIAYLSDNFQKPTLFEPDVVVAIDDVTSLSHLTLTYIYSLSNHIMLWK